MKAGSYDAIKHGPSVDDNDLDLALNSPKLVDWDYAALERTRPSWSSSLPLMTLSFVAVPSTSRPFVAS